MKWQQKIYECLLTEMEDDELARHRQSYDRLMKIKEPTKSEIMALHSLSSLLKGSGAPPRATTERRKQRRRVGAPREEEAGGRRSADPPV